MNKEEAGRTLGDYGRMLRRRWIFPAIVMPGAVLLAVFIAFVITPSYRASGTIMLEPSSIPEDMVPTTVTGTQDIPAYADQQLDIVRRRVMTNDELKKLIAEVDPYPGEKMTPMEKAQQIATDTVIERVDPITLEPLEESMAFSIHYSNPDPRLAATMAQKIVDLFISYNQRTRAEQAVAAYEFLQAQAKNLEGSMQAMEQKLAQFKAKYGDALPEAQTRNLAGIDRSQRDLEALDREIRIAEEKESLLQLQLSELSPSLMVAVGDWRTELAKLKAELALAEQKYTQEHPDVKRLKRAIAELAAQSAASAAGGGGRPDNPEYLRIESQLAAARRDLQGLRSSASRARGDMMRYEQHLGMSPEVEREYLQLARDHENMRARYQDVQGKLKDAALAQNLESEARGERFTLMRAPQMPENPFSPNRLGIILLGFVLGSGLAFGMAAMVEASDPTVRGTDDLEVIMDAAPVGAVPLLMNYADRRLRLRKLAMTAGAFGVALIIVISTVASAAHGH